MMRSWGLEVSARTSLPEGSPALFNLAVVITPPITYANTASPAASSARNAADRQEFDIKRDANGEIGRVRDAPISTTGNVDVRRASRTASDADAHADDGCDRSLSHELRWDRKLQHDGTSGQHDEHSRYELHVLDRHHGHGHGHGHRDGYQHGHRHRDRYEHGHVDRRGNWHGHRDGNRNLVGRPRVVYARWRRSVLLDSLLHRELSRTGTEPSSNALTASGVTPAAGQEPARTTAAKARRLRQLRRGPGRSATKRSTPAGVTGWRPPAGSAALPSAAGPAPRARIERGPKSRGGTAQDSPAAGPVPGLRKVNPRWVKVWIIADAASG